MKRFIVIGLAVCALITVSACKKTRIRDTFPVIRGSLSARLKTVVT